MENDIVSRAGITPESLAFSLPGALANYASNGTWQYAEHLKVLEDKLLEVANGKCKRLLVSMPPRSGKSMFISQYFTAWFLGRFPDKNVILASYEANFAASWGRLSRNVLEEHGEKIFGVEIAQDSAAADHWSIKGHTGGMHTAGAGGSLTGRGGDVIILDDVVKNDKEALSSTIQNGIWNWFQSTVYTRQAPNAAIIILMTRWAKEDLVGKLIDEMKSDSDAEQWEVLNFPAIAEENNDILGRNIGEALWPERFPIKVLEKYKKTMGVYWFSSLYQGRPQSLEGNMIKMSWFQRYTVPPAEPTAIYLSLDTATKDKEINDYSVIITACEYNNNLYILDVKRDKYVFPRLLHVTQNMILSKKPNAVIIEDKASGTQLIQTLQTGTIIAPVVAVTPSTDKATRMMNESPLIESGRIYLPENADWLLDFEDEIRAFPQSVHKDQVDAFSQLLKIWRERMCNPIDIW